MTTIGIACGQLQSILKFRSSLFKGLAGFGAAAPRKKLGGTAAPDKNLKKKRKINAHLAAVLLAGR